MNMWLATFRHVLRWFSSENERSYKFCRLSCLMLEENCASCLPKTVPVLPKSMNAPSGLAWIRSALTSPMIIGCVAVATFLFVALARRRVIEKRLKRDAEETEQRKEKCRERIRKIRLRVYLFLLFRQSVKPRAPARFQQLRICSARMPPSAVTAALRPPGLPLPESLRELAVADGRVLQMPGLTFYFSYEPTSTLLVEAFGTLQRFNRRDCCTSGCLDGGDEENRLVRPEEMELTVTIFSSSRAYHGRGDPGAAFPPSREHAKDATGSVFKIMMAFTSTPPLSEGLGPLVVAGAAINISDFGWLGNSTRALDLSPYLHSPPTGRSRQGDLLLSIRPNFERLEPADEEPAHEVELLPPGGPAADPEPGWEPAHEVELLPPGGPASDPEPGWEPAHEVELLPPGGPASDPEPGWEPAHEVELLPPGGPASDAEPGWEPAQGDLLLSNGPNFQRLETADEEPAAGAFADLSFFQDKTTGERFTLKTSEDTPEGIRSILAEINILREVVGGTRRHIVTAVETRVHPMAMILTKTEPRTLRSIGDSPSAANPAETVKVLEGVLAAIEFLSSEGFLHRDIRPENIHVSGDGTGLLADFGNCAHKEIAVLPWQIGAGTPQYQAKEVATMGSSLCSELFAVSVCFLEMMLSRNPFDGKALLLASERRRSYLERIRKELLDVLTHRAEDGNAGGQIVRDNHTGSPTTEREALAGASSRLETIRRTEWLLGIRSDEWQPDAKTLWELARTEAPLEVYVVPSQADTRSREIREDRARVEAKDYPRKVFEAADWTEWLPGTTRLSSTTGLRKLVSLVVEKGMLDPNPADRPHTTAALQSLLHGALRLYYETMEAEVEEVERQRLEDLAERVVDVH